MRNDERTIVTNIRMHRDGTWYPDDDGSRLRWEIEIEDEATGIHFLELRMTDAQFASMHSPSGGQDVTTAVVPARLLAKLGNISWHVSVPLAFGYDGDREGRPETRLKNLVESAALDREVGAEYADVSRHRDGISLTFRGYAPDADAAVKAAADCARYASAMVKANGWVLASPTSEPRPYPTAADLAQDERRSRRRGAGKAQ